MRHQLKALLARFSRKRALGLVLADDRVSVCQVVHTALGPVERARYVETAGNDPIEGMLKRALEPVMKRKEWRGAHVAVGLPALRFLFTARPVSAMQREATGEALLHESLQLTNVLIDDLAVDMMRAGGSKQATACILATRKRYLEPLLEALLGVGIRPHTVEPAAFGLLRLAEESHRAPARARAVVRVFLGSESGLAILAAGERPLGWRSFSMPAASSMEAVVTAVNGMRPLASRAGLEEPPNVVLIHGRPDLAGLAVSSGWSEGLKVHHHPGPALDDSEAAHGVATGCHREDDGFNLARALRPAGSILSVFPWTHALIELTVLGIATAFLMSQYLETGVRVGLLETKVAQHTWMGDKNVGDLQTEKESLTKRLESVQGFLASRMCWTQYTHEVATKLPKTMRIVSLTGKNPYVDPGKKGAKGGARSLLLQLEEPVEAAGTAPRDRMTLLNNFRNSPLLKSNLPVQDLTEVQWSTRGKTGETIATFSMTCQSPVKKAK